MQGTQRAPEVHGDLINAQYGRDFQLRDPYGKTRTLADFRGKVVMLFFGYTQCPDVCPTALNHAAAIKEQLRRSN
jgi:protein SCO1/2